MHKSAMEKNENYLKVTQSALAVAVAVSVLMGGAGGVVSVQSAAAEDGVIESTDEATDQPVESAVPEETAVIEEPPVETTVPEPTVPETTVPEPTVPDVDNSSIKLGVTGKKAEVDGVTWYGADTEVVVGGFPNQNTSKYRVLLNGRSVRLTEDTDRPGTYFVDMSRVVSGEANEIKVVYKKNIFSEDTVLVQTVYLDTDAPKSVAAEKQNLSTTTPWGTYLVEGGSLKVKISASDQASGVHTIVATAPEDGDKPARAIELTPGSVHDTENRLDWVYHVVDNVGNHTSDYKLTDLIKTGNTTAVVEDTGKPVVESTRGTGDVLYTITVKDTALKSLLITTGDNGEVFVPTIKFNTETQEYVYELKKSQISEALQTKYKGEIPVQVTVTDYLEQVTTEGITVDVDTQVPYDIRATTNTEIVQTAKWGNFTKEALVVTVSAKQDVRGIDHYEMYNGTDLNTTPVIANDGVFTNLPENPYFRVVSKSGVTTELIPLSEILNLTSNKFTVDSTTPDVSINYPESQSGLWYSDDVAFTVNTTTDGVLGHAVVKINGQVVEEVDYNKAEDITRKATYTVTTAGREPNSDGSYNIEIIVTSISGLETKKSSTVFVDKEKPVIDGFVFDEAVRVEKGQYYGYYFQGATTVKIEAHDPGHSSGIQKYVLYLIHADGKEEVFTQESPRFAIPANFKGRIQARVVDNVENTSNDVEAQGIVSETANWHATNARIDIALNETPYRTATGQRLYNANQTVVATIQEPKSGVATLSWGINGETFGSYEVGSEFTAPGVQVLKKDQNLIVLIDVTFANIGNANDQKLWVETTSKTGYSMREEQVISVDTVAPQIEVTPIAGGYYNEHQSATITVTDANFDPNQVEVSGEYGSLSGWTYVGNNMWTNTMSFTEERDYQWSIKVTDRAGNTSDTYTSSKFTVDTVNPVLEVSFDNNNVESGQFYKESRTATLTVTDRNFDPANATVNGGEVTGWSQSGEVWTANVPYNTDGEYSLTVSVADKAKNRSQEFSSGQFIVDLTKPNLVINGVRSGVAYRKDVAGSVESTDKYFDASRSSVTLLGSMNGKMEMVGTFKMDEGGNIALPEFPKDKKYDDKYILIARVFDKAGNSEERIVEFIVDRNGSSYLFLTQDYKGKYIQKVEQPVVAEVTSVTPLNMDKFDTKLTLEGEAVTVNKEQVKITRSGGDSKPWKYELEMSPELFQNDGSYRIQVYSTAEDGLESSSMDQEYGFVVVSEAPEIVVTGVETDGRYLESYRDVQIEARGLAPVNTISAELNGEKVELSGNGPYTLRVNERGTEQALSVRVVDLAGNERTVEITDFMVSTTTISDKPWLPWVIGASGVLIAGLLGALGWRMLAARKSRRDQVSDQSDQIASSTN